MTVHTVYVICIAPNGSRTMHPVGAVSDEKLRDELVQEAKMMHQAYHAMHVVEMTPEGPRGVMPVPQLLATLGIANIGTMTMSAEVKESNLVLPQKPQIILQ